MHRGVWVSVSCEHLVNSGVWKDGPARGNRQRNSLTSGIYAPGQVSQVLEEPPCYLVEGGIVQERSLGNPVLLMGKKAEAGKEILLEGK